MANSVKRLYEGMFIVDSALAASNWDEASNTVKSILDRGNAEILNIRKWDDCRLCYEIKKHRRGTYILSYFRADSSVITAMERDVQLSETVLRALILRADHISDDEQKANEQMNMATPFELIDDEEAADEGQDDRQEAPVRAAAAKPKYQAKPADDDDDASDDSDDDQSEDQDESQDKE